jgi:hypothetical protein
VQAESHHHRSRAAGTGRLHCLDLFIDDLHRGHTYTEATGQGAPGARRIEPHGRHQVETGRGDSEVGGANGGCSERMKCRLRLVREVKVP